MCTANRCPPASRRLAWAAWRPSKVWDLKAIQTLRRICLRSKARILGCRVVALGTNKTNSLSLTRCCAEILPARLFFGARGRTRPEFGRTLKVIRVGPSVVDVGPRRSNFDPSLADVGRPRAELGRVPTKCVQHRPSSIEVGSSFAEIGPGVVESGQVWPKPVQLVPRFR